MYVYTYVYMYIYAYICISGSFAKNAIWEYQQKVTNTLSKARMYA